MTFAFALVLAQSPPKITMQFLQDQFVIRKGSEKELIPVKYAPKRLLPVVFRKDKSFAVWDDRGLTIRSGRRAYSTRLSDIAVSRKVFEREEILANLELFKQKKRSKDADALSGAKRIGAVAYFLVRWDDADSKPWLEALVSVDLAEKKPQWRLVGKFEGLSTATSLIDDKLFIRNGTLAVITKKDDSWGESFYATEAKAFGFKKFGDKLVEFQEEKDSKGDYIEQTAYGTYVGGLLDIDLEKKTEAFECRGPCRLMGTGSPMFVAIREGAGEVVRNVQTGAEMPLPEKFDYARTKFGLAVWTPSENPTKAWLYDPRSWRTLSTWTQAAR